MRKHVVRSGLALAATILAAALGACGGSGSGSGSPASSGAAATGNGPMIGFSESVAANPNNKAIDDGAAVKAKALGMKLVITDANLDLAKQTSDIQSLRRKGIKALLTSPIDENSMRPVLTDVKQQMPVITWSAAGPYSTVDFQSTDYEAAKEAAHFIAAKVGSGASVAAIQGLPQIPILKARNQGFLDGAKEAGLKVVATQVNTKDNADSARPIVDAWKAKFGKGLKAIWAYNDPSALGAASAKDASFDPVITGMNGSQDAVDAVKQGLIAATWDQRAAEIGNGESWAAYQILVKKRTLPRTIYVPLVRVDSSTVDRWVPVAERLKHPLHVAIKQVGGRPTLVTG